MPFDWRGRARSIVNRIMIPLRTIYQSFQAEPAVSDRMERALTLWYQMYIDAPPWATEDMQPLGLPRAIACEFARTISSELTVSIDGGERAKFLEEQLTRLLPELQSGLELGIALGGLALKPYVANGSILVDATGPTGFTPLRFDSGGVCVAGVFKSAPVKVGRDYYIKLEHHDLTGEVYTIQNKAFTSSSDGSCGMEVELERVLDWEGIRPEVTIRDVKRPLFGYFTPSNRNSIDTASHVGVSVYSGATEGLIRQADAQWERYLYEFQSAERKIMATSDAITGVLVGGRPNPLANNRLYVQMPYDNEKFFQEFSPALRNTGFYDGLQAIFRRIEFNVGLAYGDISDPATVEKTATEVMASKHRKRNSARGMEKRLETALQNAIYGMNVYATLYELSPKGDYTAYIDFDDGILTDADSQRESDRRDVQDGLMQPWEYRVRWYNESEETAKAMAPPRTAPPMFEEW